MKKINLFIVGLVAMLGFTTSAMAADSASLSCTNKEIAPGESTNCTITINTTTSVTSAIVELDTSEYLTVSEVTPGTGWTDMKAVAPKYSFESATASTGSKQLFSFKLTLSKAAENIDAENCGQLCIQTLTFNSGDDAVKVQPVKGSTGTCFLPTVVEKTTDPKNPETGAFANYAIILGVAAIAVVSIIGARKATKFYRV